MATPEERLRELGIELAPVPKPRWAYVPAVLIGNLLFVSGQGVIRHGAPLYPGKLGAEVTVEQGQEVARACAVSALAIARDQLGSLDRVERVVKLTVFVASAPGFGRQPDVANGASEFLRAVFGEGGLGARSAVGVAELPMGIPVEVEFIFAVRP